VARGDEQLSTGRARRPADSIPGVGPVPRSAERLAVRIGHAVGERLDRAVLHRHRNELRHAGWEHALDATSASFVRDGADPRPGNAVEVLIDGVEALPRIAEELSRAQSHVHMTGWFISPDLQLTREDEPVIVRNLLAELAERIDVPVLLWQGAPVPAFRPSRGDVRNVRENLVRHTRIKSASTGAPASGIRTTRRRS
jgi:phosphatidylserine/phosphatidylglycerophosphate/cardiolipin synthase-like enzyme